MHTRTRAHMHPQQRNSESTCAGTLQELAGGYDAAHWTDRAKAVTAGALMCGGLKLYMSSRGRGSRRLPRLGLLLGASLATGVMLLQSGLCRSTPYCWSTR